jgi:hypothetical protein
MYSRDTSIKTGSPLSTRPVQSRHTGTDAGAWFTGPKVAFSAVIGQLLMVTDCDWGYVRHHAPPAQGGTFVSPRHNPDRCPATREVLNRVGDKWSVLIVGMLGGGLSDWADDNRVTIQAARDRFDAAEAKRVEGARRAGRATVTGLLVSLKS